MYGHNSDFAKCLWERNNLSACTLTVISFAKEIKGAKKYHFVVKPFPGKCIYHWL